MCYIRRLDINFKLENYAIFKTKEWKTYRQTHMQRSDYCNRNESVMSVKKQH